jgi:uncharacterized linocin/CFP29 family protein
MSHLLRRHAPITEERWAEIEAEARTRLTPHLGARQVVDFRGPHGWQYAATSLGRIEAVPDRQVPGTLSVSRRRVLPTIELRAPFALSRSELEAGDRGADDVDYGPLDAGARTIATAENAAIINGWAEAMVTGIREAGRHDPTRAGSVSDMAVATAQAVERLFAAGIDGPFALALGSTMWAAVQGSSERGGWPLVQHLGEILDGPVVYTPGADDAVVLSLRGGDFLLDSGQDLSVGYHSHDSEVVNLYLEESLTFHVATPEAAVVIAFGEE